MLIATVNQTNTVHQRSPFSGQGGNQMTETAAQIRDGDLSSSQPSRPGNHGRVLEVAITKSAWSATETLAIHLNRRPHTAQSLSKAKAVLVYRLVDNRQSLSLCQSNDKRLLPVGHKARMHIGF